MCHKIKPSSQKYFSNNVYNAITRAIERNQNKQPPDYAHLAIAYSSEEWAHRFKISLINEMQKEYFTQPANSVKYDQHLAALRVYYFHQMELSFPNLFSKNEKDEIINWFHKINQRALTVEWVDWLYAIAFSKTPEGPYENQENGAGLLALLEVYGYADPKLSQKNRSYLSSRQFGWNGRFRNNDDVLSYQAVWLTNAYFISIYENYANKRNQELSYKWLLLQALPNGAPYNYNSPYPVSLALPAYQGYVLTKDKEMLWLAGRAVEYLEKHGQSLSTLPGTEKRVENEFGESPNFGSCIIYAETGLPNQKGPIAPDKVVLRDGWELDSTFLLINLRFTGWHRYKATGTITSLYKKGLIFSDNPEPHGIKYLPLGRKLLRDKRINREDLNGFIINRVGVDKVIHQLTNYGSQWAQNPPLTINNIELIDTNEIVRVSLTMDWNSWKAKRVIILYKNNKIVRICDTATSEGKKLTAGYIYHPISNENIKELYSMVLNEKRVISNSKRSLLVINESNTPFIEHQLIIKFK